MTIGLSKWHNQNWQMKWKCFAIEMKFLFCLLEKYASKALKKNENWKTKIEKWKLKIEKWKFEKRKLN